MRKIHLYISLPFGILLSLICFSGAMLVLEKKVCAVTQRELLYVEPMGRTALSLDTLKKKAEQTLPEGTKVTSITIFGEPGRSYQMSLSAPRKASIYVDPYSGAVLGKGERTAFFRTMFRMHRWLLGPAKSSDGSIGWGKMLVGGSTLVFVFVVLSGIVIWWPRNKKVLKRSLQIPIRHGLRPFFRGLHVTGGVYATVLLLVMALTGLTWSFGWYRSAFYSLFGVSAKPSIAHTASFSQGDDKKKTKGEKKKGTAEFSWQSAYETVVAQQPEFKQLTLSPKGSSISLGKAGNSRAADKYIHDTSGKKIVSIDRYADRSKEKKIGGWMFSLHTGTFGGIATRTLWFFTALLGAILPLTGYYLWWKRIRRNHKNSPPENNDIEPSFRKSYLGKTRS